MKLKFCYGLLSSLSCVESKIKEAAAACKKHEMADVTVTLVLEKLVSVITSEASLLTGLPRALVAINNEMRSIKIFLRDAEIQAEENDVTKEWVRQVRMIAYEIEDVIDEHLVLQHRPHGHSDHQWWRVLHKLTHPMALLRLHRIARTIKGIHSEILEINQRRSYLTLDRVPSSLCGVQDEDLLRPIVRDPRAGFLYVDESELVGIEDPKRDLIKLLDLELQDYPQSRVISVVGMGGLGKTTLVRKVYEDMSVRKYFPFRAWITLSRPGKSVKIIRNMIKQFRKAARDNIPLEIDSMEEEPLVDELRNYLQEQRFLIVFDDVWNNETYFKNILPANNKGCKILMTTRIESVAFAWKESSYDHLYKLQPLSPTKAWNLFCRKAFRDSEDECPRELEKFSHDIVRKCEGLPLAIVTIGGMLSTKDKSVYEWQKLCNSVSVELANNCQLANIKKILLLSYHDLPHELKPCFLYLGIFPPDRSIELQRLIRLWMAEDFIKNTPGKTPEAVAYEYLMELIHRSLVHVTWVDVTGRPRNIRVHDLLREIILLKSKDLSFFRVLNNENLLVDAQSRRLVIRSDEVDSSTKIVVEGTSKKPCVRSLFLFARHETVPKFLKESFGRILRLLRVLDFQNAPVKQIPEATGNLRHLKFLSLKGTNVEKLPRSIGKLRKLQTLDLKTSRLHEIPLEVSRLSELRHLLSYSYSWDNSFSDYLRKVIAAKVPVAVCHNCPEMQNLGWVDVSQSVGLIQQMGNLKQLRRLGVAQLAREDGRNLCKAIMNMHCLEEFLIASRNKDEFLDIDYISSLPKICRLLLMGRLQRLPEWILALDNVAKLVLCHSKLKDDPLDVLGALPNLVKLILSEAYDGEHIYIGATRFQKLKILRLYNLRYLKSVEIVKGALPVLKELELGPSPDLKEVPICIRNLQNLTLLRFHDMPKKFSDSMAPNTGECYHVVEHVPNVYFNYIVGAGHWVTSTLKHPQNREMVSYKTGADYHRIKRGTAWAPIDRC